MQTDRDLYQPLIQQIEMPVVDQFMAYRIPQILFGQIGSGQDNTGSEKLKTVKGYEFLQPARIYSQNDTVFWVSDMHGGSRTLVKMIVHKGEIRE